MDRQQIIDTLTGEFGGNLWEKYGKSRIYFEGAAIAARQGLTTSRYGSGNISSAHLNGKSISNSEAKRILSGFMWLKLWYDLDEGKFLRRGEIDYPGSQKLCDQFIADAKAAIA